MLTMNRAQIEDAQVLTEISKRAFDSDIEVGNNEIGGPPGYDEVEWQTDMINNPKAHYYKLVLDNTIVGGAIVFPLKKESNYCLGRIFIDTNHIRQGLGQQALALIENAYPDAVRWVLETPAWNVRTRAFYQKVGYKLIKEDEDLIFEKLF